MLELSSVVAGYGPSRVLNGIDLHVGPGEIVALFGRNGVGKTTTLKTVMGWMKPTAGSIRFKGSEIAGVRPDQVCRLGIGLIPEDRRVFPTLTVEENLRLGGFQAPRRPKRETLARLDEVYSRFPRLAERHRQSGRTLSGGEQQMLVIGRALMGSPSLLLIDEPSEGLAPIIVRDVFDSIRAIAADGISILLVEQHVKKAVQFIDRMYVLEKGMVVAEARPDELEGNENLTRRLAV